MSNSQFSDNKFTRFLSGKGFYVVLAVCLAGAGTAAYVAVNRSPANLAEQNSQTNIARVSQAEQWGFPQFEDAARNQSGVAAPSPSSSQPPKASSSEPRSSGPAKPSGASAEQAPLQSLSFVLPINGEIFADFSGDTLVKNETLGDWRTHNGIDIKAEKGVQVEAVAVGTVKDVRNDPLWGYVVEIDHGNGLVSVYAGLDKKTQVAKGDAVKPGQVIGTVDYIPCESLLENHLHFEMKKNGKFVDPLGTMNKRK